MLHVELRLTASGPSVIEVNGRPAGDLIPLLVERATGINIPQDLATLATGETPRPKGCPAMINWLWRSVSGRRRSA